MKKYLAVLLVMLLIFSMAVLPASAAGLDPAAGPVEILADLGWVIFAGIICLAIIFVAAISFAKKPKDEQINMLKEWLLWAVVQAEKELGSGTGELKLRYVYDMFLVKFPWLAKLIPFETFHGFVLEALERMEKLLNDNEDIKALIKPETETNTSITGFASDR